MSLLLFGHILGTFFFLLFTAPIVYIIYLFLKGMLLLYLFIFSELYKSMPVGFRAFIQAAFQVWMKQVFLSLR